MQARQLHVHEPPITTLITITIKQSFSQETFTFRGNYNGYGYNIGNRTYLCRPIQSVVVNS